MRYFAPLAFALLAATLASVDAPEPILIRGYPTSWLLADGLCVSHTVRGSEVEALPPEVEAWPLDAAKAIRLGRDGFKRCYPFGSGVFYVPGAPDLELAEPPYGKGDWIPIEPRIDSVTASSSFAETLGGRRFEYGPERMLDRFVTPEFHSIYWNADAIPWVEGVPGSGVGEWFEARSSSELYGFAMLGGYVDFAKPDLYRKNGRPSRIRVESVAGAKFSFEVDIDDFVHFERIWFPSPTRAFRVTLLEVREGSHYADTCVSAIAGFPLRKSDYDRAHAKLVETILALVGSR